MWTRSIIAHCKVHSDEEEEDETSSKSRIGLMETWELGRDDVCLCFATFAGWVYWSEKVAYEQLQQRSRSSCKYIPAALSLAANLVPNPYVLIDSAFSRV